MNAKGWEKEKEHRKFGRRNIYLAYAKLLAKTRLFTTMHSPAWVPIQIVIALFNDKPFICHFYALRRPNLVIVRYLDNIESRILIM
jgi:hypothetical protein